jgi:FAD/FMN-containing dehydrogenase
MPGQIHHQFVFPDDSRWDDARQAWNLAAHQWPAVVALPTSIEEVVAAVNYAVERDLRIVVQGTGHGAAAHGSLDGALLLNMRELRGVEIDAAKQRARVEAGAVWEDVVVPATEHGLTALHGSSPNVGVVGYSLGGGIGWLARKHGLSADSVTAIELVTAGGALLRADRTENTDLFWALRGGGGGLGVIVSVEIALYPVDELVAGMMIWPWEHSQEVLTRYVAWARTAPNEVSASARMLQIPPLPDIPEQLRGRQIVVIDGAVLGSEEKANEILATFRELEPEIDTFGPAPAAALIRLHMDPEPPMPGIGDGVMVDDLDAEAIAAIVGTAGPGTGSPLILVELRQLGGALRERRPGAGALGALDGSFAFFALGAPMGPGVGEAVEQRIEQLKDAIAPWSRGKPYLNFADKKVALGDAIGTEAFARLARIKASVDPGNVFRSAHRFETGTVETTTRLVDEDALAA